MKCEPRTRRNRSAGELAELVAVRGYIVVPHW